VGRLHAQHADPVRVDQLKTAARGQALALAAIVALGLGLRLQVARHAPCFWDEGYLVEAAQSLAHAQRPQVSGLWQDGFFPLSTSALAPLSLAPLLALAPGPQALMAGRLWALLLQGLALLLLARAGARLGGWALGLLAAATYAAMPFAVEHGGRCFYHHLAVVLLLAAVNDGLEAHHSGRAAALARASLWGGLAVAVAYWLWWLPLAWAGLLLARRPRGWGLALGLAALGPCAALAVNVAPDPPGAWWSMKSLLWTSGLNAPHGAQALVSAVGADLTGLPFLAVGALGLLLAAWRWRGPWAWLALLGALCTLEPIRQRGAIPGIAYPFQLAAPLAALGAAALALAAWRSASPWRRWLAPLALALALWPVNMGWVNLLSFDPAPIEQLCAYFDAHAQPGDGVCGMPEINWRVGQRLRACDPFAVGAADGRATGFYLAGAPASRLAWDCRVTALRYAVVSRIHPLSVFRTRGVALTFLQMERQGWQPCFDNGTFRVYQDPRFDPQAAPKAPATLLLAPEFYRYAAADADAAGRPLDAAYARARAASLAAP
jgi:hypothetical protein